MRLPLITIAALLMPSFPAMAGSATPALTGDYVEARTAEVFAGGCIMSSEAETIGRQAVMAWRINRGALDGVTLDGLAVVAAVSGDRNLGIREIGGSAPTRVDAAIIVDVRATPAQRDALVALVRRASEGLIDRVVEITPSPIRFEADGHLVRVETDTAKLTVQRHIHHDPSCGAMQWFHPLASVDDAVVGLTDVNAFSSGVLGVKWSDPHRRSGFVGTFGF
jgi:hypothetical protein